jgi:hypothetical protein
MTEPESLPLLTAGAPPTSARAAMLLFHGRGATAESIILKVADAFAEPDIALLAPQAPNGTWYPYFLARFAKTSRRFRTLSISSANGPIDLAVKASRQITSYCSASHRAAA